MKYTITTLLIATMVAGLLLAMWQLQPVLAIFAASITPVLLVVMYRRVLRNAYRPLVWRTLLGVSLVLAYVGSIGPYQLLYVQGHRNTHWWTQAVTTTASIVYAPLSSETILGTLHVDDHVHAYKHHWQTIRVRSIKRLANWFA